MLQRKPDESLIDVFVGNSNSRMLSELEIQLALIQSACTMALEGTTRATASEIAARALQSYKVEITASFTGQVFANLGVHSVTTHGKNRLILDADQLEEIRKDIASRCEKAVDKLKASVEKFRDLPEKIEELQKEWKQTLAIRAKEQELIRLINEDRRNPTRLDYLEDEYRKIQQRNERINEIQKEAKALALKEKKLPSLKERKETIEARIAEHEKKTRALIEKEREIAGKEQENARKEATLTGRLEKLQKRLGWLELTSLEEQIESSKKELNSISKQLVEKRSLLDIFRRNKGGAST